MESNLQTMIFENKDSENMGKGENAGNQHFLFIIMFSALTKIQSVIYNAFNLVQSKTC